MKELRINFLVAATRGKYSSQWISTSISAEPIVFIELKQRIDVRRRPACNKLTQYDWRYLVVYGGIKSTAYGWPSTTRPLGGQDL